MLALMFFVPILLRAVPPEPSVALVPLSTPSPSANKVAWVNDGEKEWMFGAPVFSISNASGDPSAQGWIAATEGAILLHVVVQDDTHLNANRGGNLWNGDALQIGVDLSGAGVGRLPKETVMTGSHSAALGFALTANGPEAYVFTHSRPDRVGEAPQLAPGVVRDENKKTTTYDISLPWSEFQATPGLFSRLGLALQVNDTDTDSKQKRINWGRGGNGPLQPGLFKWLTLGTPGTPLLSLEATKTNLWKQGDRGEFVIAMARRKESSLAVDITINGKKSRSPLPELAGQGEGIDRYAIRIDPGAWPVRSCDVAVQVVNADDGAVLAEANAALDSPGEAMSDVHARLQAASIQAAHPLLARHFSTVDSLALTEWAASLTVAEEVPAYAFESTDNGRRILAEMDRPQTTQWEPYRNGLRRLVLSYISTGDRSLQFYQLRLPQNWQPGKPYPLVVSLHGSGAARTMPFVADSFCKSVDQANPHDEAWQAYELMSWGRGDYGYSDIAEKDVMLAIEDIQKTVAVDADRIYLTGFSLGGGGAWNLMIRHPDLWAAVAICSGGPWWAPVGQGLGGNAAAMPVLLWHGESDAVVPVEETYQMSRELEGYGNKPERRIVPERGHEFRPDEAISVRRWLLSKGTKKRPAAASFVAPDFESLSCYGITLKWVPEKSLHPKFSFVIDGQELKLTTEGTDGARVDLEALGMTGNVTLIWNGTKSYEGPAREITLGTGGERE